CIGDDTDRLDQLEHPACHRGHGLILRLQPRRILGTLTITGRFGSAELIEAPCVRGEFGPGRMSSADARIPGYAWDVASRAGPLGLRHRPLVGGVGIRR